MVFRPGVTIDVEPINVELRRRQGGYGAGWPAADRNRRGQFLTGVWKGVTLGSPIALEVPNSDYKLERLDDLPRPRPGHADLTGAMKYLGSIRGVLERASARETAVRVAAGRWPSNCWPSSASRCLVMWSSWAASELSRSMRRSIIATSIRDQSDDLLA